jgi:hypothetical protein
MEQPTVVNEHILQFLNRENDSQDHYPSAVPNPQ